jgi:alkylation response protein AidB-like acyl-CoA dehydrogenase
MLSLLKQFAGNEAVHAIQIEQARSGAYKYTVYHGVHRYYASVAAGYLYLPVVEMKPEDMSRLREVFERKR